jgi:cytidylate kinase
MAVITISRDPGASGEEIAARLAGRLGFVLIDKPDLLRLWRELDLDETSLAKVDEQMPPGSDGIDSESEAIMRMLPDLIVQMAEDHDLIVLGRGAQGLFRNRPGTLHIRVVAPRSFRVRYIQDHEKVSAKEARHRIRTLETQRARYLRFLYGLNRQDAGLYDLTLRMDRLSTSQALKLIGKAADEMRIRQVPRGRIVENLLPEAAEDRGRGRFANASEEEFACYLQFYGIPYEYEPRSFPLKVDAQGRVSEAFTPDFYLPQQDLYIELTTMKQSLVTRKNRKVRKLKQLYPEINIRIFYQRDFYRLMAKYGLLTGDAGRPEAGPGRAGPPPACELRPDATENGESR